jgi:hypothetical protein
VSTAAVLGGMSQRGLGDRRDMIDSATAGVLFGGVDGRPYEDRGDLCPKDGSMVRRRWRLL